ncbi:hypothetical protein D3C86_1387050 [compost metagenome]
MASSLAWKRIRSRLKRVARTRSLRTSRAIAVTARARARPAWWRGPPRSGNKSRSERPAAATRAAVRGLMTVKPGSTRNPGDQSNIQAMSVRPPITTAAHAAA